MRFAAGNAQHIGARPQQQDSFGFSDPDDKVFVEHGGFLGIVADGVGGLTHGGEASQSAVRAFLQAYHQKPATESIPDALSRALREANTAVLRVASEPSGEGAGTTLVAAVLHRQALYWVSVGDSRVYLLHGGKLTRVTSDHTYARELDEQAAQGKISRAEAQSHSERGSLTSYLGQSEPKEVDRNSRPLPLQSGDSVIVCSDGFYRAVDEAEITAAFQNNLQAGCETLVKQIVAKQRPGQDNLTVIALQHSRAKGNYGGRISSRGLAAALVVAVSVSVGAGFWYERFSSSGTPIPHPVPAIQPVVNSHHENVPAIESPSTALNKRNATDGNKNKPTTDKEDQVGKKNKRSRSTKNNKAVKDKTQPTTSGQNKIPSDVTANPAADQGVQSQAPPDNKAQEGNETPATSTQSHDQPKTLTQRPPDDQDQQPPPPTQPNSTTPPNPAQPPDDNKPNGPGRVIETSGTIFVMRDGGRICLS